MKHEKGKREDTKLRNTQMNSEKLKIIRGRGDGSGLEKKKKKKRK